MADIIFSQDTAALGSSGPEAGPADREPTWDLIELLFFAYRDFVSDPDHVLEKFGFGRAHHRVLHFVNRNPGMKVADLLDTLRITKQSLGRVLKQLVDEGYVLQKEGPDDRRHRLLYVTPKGRAARDEARRTADRADHPRARQSWAERARKCARLSGRHDRCGRPRRRAAFHCPGRSRTPARRMIPKSVKRFPACAKPW
jgi:DNA-binding MarR family transcriptional regulator